jgi:pimeloyl-ACP methyl ester carboxylesterase/class 3 adenylate cyclase
VELAPHPVRYAQGSEVQIAYQTLGEGPRDLLFHFGFPSHLELQWEHPAVARFYRRLASFSRLILFDRRGTGLSERGREMHGFEEQMDDIRAVMDALGSEQCCHVGVSVGGRVALLFAATYPERTTAVATIASHPATLKAEPDYPWGSSPEDLDYVIESVLQGWGSAENLDEFLAQIAPSVADDPFTRDWWLRFVRSAMSPREVAEDLRALAPVDIRRVLPTVRVPTLIMHRSQDRMADIRASRYMAERIPGGRFVELPGEDELPFFGDQDAILDELEEFFTGVRPTPRSDRVLATVFFTDIVGSTKRAAELGDRRWRDVLEVHDSLVRRELSRFGGREIDTAGDGFLATFDSPARAIRCAESTAHAIHGMGLEIRAGVHTGELELVADQVRGIAVHIGARVAALAGGREVFVSQTVKDLVAGSGFTFEDQGIHALKGIPDDWRIYKVLSSPSS